jgi:hypothetical protein
MDDTINLDQTEEETLTYEVSDEALERAAGVWATTSMPFQMCTIPC